MRLSKSVIVTPLGVISNLTSPVHSNENQQPVRTSAVVAPKVRAKTYIRAEVDGRMNRDTMYAGMVINTEKGASISIP